ncbi:helix-turn-helix domain-containing protein [Nonomuraea dietziae]|uniref:helix-turn-helix domain-containing protein n=1 Tax=Nonomuraea dietziae TaxID=65515 RepID=UPI003414DDA4
MFTPTRLTLARKRRGLTLVRLAQRSGISARSLSAYENGHQQPTVEALAALASTLEFPDAFLQAEDIEEVPVEAISFRARSKRTAAQKDAARSAGRIAIAINDWVETRFRLPEPDVPSLPNLDPETAAQVVRARWGLGHRPISNMVHLLEAHGVRVYALVADCADIDAFSLYWRATPFLFLNLAKSGERGRFDAAHELGHLVMHGEEAAAAGPQAEAAANRFAAAFLMPAADILARSLHEATSERILRAKQVWKVSAMALAHRLHEMQLLSDWAYRTACVDLARRGYRSGEPGGIPRENSQLLSKVFKALRAEHIRQTDIARPNCT